MLLSILRMLCTSLILLVSTCAGAQEAVKAKAIADRKQVWLFNAHLNLDQPIMDYGKRFGPCYKIGGSILRKNASNMFFGLRMDFVLGNNIKEDSVTWNWYNSAGYAIDNNGQPRNPALFQRGYQVGVDVGKVFNVWAANSNSGLTWLSSYGFMQYRINIFDQDNGFAQFAGEYEKGYDRLTNGLFTEQFIGYTYLGKSKSLNFVFGAQLNYARNGGRRTWLYDVNRSGLDQRNDASIGLKLMWLVPRYVKAVEETYY
jgi:hypothetical protein